MVNLQFIMVTELYRNQTTGTIENISVSIHL